MNDIFLYEVPAFADPNDIKIRIVTEAQTPTEVVIPPEPRPPADTGGAGRRTGPAFPPKRRRKALRSEIEELEQLQAELLERAAAQKSLEPVKQQLSVISPLMPLMTSAADLKAAIAREIAELNRQIEEDDEDALVAVLVALSH